MKITDNIYGSTEIDETVIIQVINSAPIQRLKGLAQAGVTRYMVEQRSTVSRFDHSLGVMFLLRKFGASLEEQLAGLLHDVSHTAFSHVVDFAFPEYGHEFHEKFLTQVIYNSTLPTILENNDISLTQILDKSNFSLLENELPDICADRIDYTLRDMSSLLGYDQQKIDKYLASLINKDGQFVFNNKDMAYQFALDFIKMDNLSWSDPREVAIYQVVGEAIRLAVNKKYITQTDLFMDDDFLFKKLKQIKDLSIRQKVAQVNPNFKIEDNPDDYDYYCRNKLRFVDPKYIDNNGNTKRVTDSFPEFKKKLAEHEQKITRGIFVKIIS